MWNIIITSLPTLLSAMLKYTIPLALISFAIGLVIAIVAALIKFFNPKGTPVFRFFWKILQGFNNFYIWIFRSTPLLVQLFIIFFGLPNIGLQIDPFVAAVIGFSLNTGAYGSEIIRSSLMSVPQDQWDAAYTLCFSTRKTLTKIILPQALRIALPPLGNSFISLVKDTSLASSITILEMFQVSQQITAKNFQPLLMYTIVALLYALICSLLNLIQRRIEKNASKYIKGGRA